MRLLQAIDIGTNSVRSIIVEVPVGGEHRVIDDEKVMAKLGEGLEATGRLSDEAMSRTIDALATLIDIGRRRAVTEVRAVATEAVRRATNGPEFVARATDELGLTIEVISGEEEGRLVWLSASPLLATAPLGAVVDIGGGSVEIVQSVAAEPAAISSMSIGVRVLAERAGGCDPLDERGFKKLRRRVRRVLRDSVTPLAVTGVTLVGSGGAVTATAALIAAARGRRYDTFQGMELLRPEIVQLLDDLSMSTAAQRAALPGMPADRIDTIVPGVLVLSEVVRLFDATTVIVNAKGFREGIVVDALASAGVLDPTPDAMRAVRELGRRYRYDRDHAEQVTKIALEIFGQMGAIASLDPGAGLLLEAAALLHDVGYFVSYDSHHKHSYHLILHSALPGFTHRELSMVASIARYHTKALPKRKHESWAGIEPSDRATVRSLGAILRIADALDRGRGERVKSVRLVDDGATTRFVVRADGDLHAEAYGFEKKKDLFEESFGRDVVLGIEGLESQEP